MTWITLTCASSGQALDINTAHIASFYAAAYETRLNLKNLHETRMGAMVLLSSGKFRTVRETRDEIRALLKVGE